jgi:hypothetical protein
MGLIRTIWNGGGATAVPQIFPACALCAKTTSGDRVRIVRPSAKSLIYRKEMYLAAPVRPGSGSLATRLSAPFPVPRNPQHMEHGLTLWNAPDRFAASARDVARLSRGTPRKSDIQIRETFRGSAERHERASLGKQREARKDFGTSLSKSL